MTYHGIDISQARIADFCHRHRIRRFSLFGSILRDDFRPDSDIDVLVEFEAGRTLLDRIGMIQDLEDLLGRKVDVVTEKALHHLIRQQVLQQAVPL